VRHHAARERHALAVYRRLQHSRRVVDLQTTPRGDRAPPANLRIDGQPLGNRCGAGPVPVVDEDTFPEVTWDAVTTSHPTPGRSAPIEIAEYEIVVERDDFKASATLPADELEFALPTDVLQAGERMKIEILVRATNGNRTAIETCFDVE
jgi:hypothetical protein